MRILEDRGMYGFVVQCYARDWDNGRGPLPHDQWRKDAVAVSAYTNNPPLGGQIAGIEAVIGLDTGTKDVNQANDAVREAKLDREVWLQALVDEKLIGAARERRNAGRVRSRGAADGVLRT